MPSRSIPKTLVRAVLKSPVGTLARKARRQILDAWDNDTRLNSAVVADAALLRAGLRGNPRGTTHVLVTSTGERNIGDQAMLDAYLGATTGPTIAIVHGRSTYVFPEARDQLRIVSLPGLLYGRGVAHERDVKRFASLLNDAKSLSFVGADVVDGGYQRRSAAITWGLAAAAAGAGLDTRVLGFSWKSDVDSVTRALAASAASAGAKLLARDPHSASRLDKDGVAPVTLTADGVFTLPSVTATADDLTDRTKRVIVNVSGLIQSRVDLSSDYQALLSELVARGYEVTLLPHVDNPGGSDTAACRAVLSKAEEAGLSEIALVPDLLSPLEVKSLCQRADFVVTGRMHLSILALSVGVPALILSTQGKVSGLVEVIGHPEWCLEPVKGWSTLALQQIDLLEADGDSTRKLLAEKAVDLAEKAKLNYEGLA